jgi:hypothetical protein
MKKNLILFCFAATVSAATASASNHIAKRDTTPYYQTDMTSERIIGDIRIIEKRKIGQDITMQFKENALISLKINGKDIPKNEWSQYEDIIKDVPPMPAGMTTPPPTLTMQETNLEYDQAAQPLDFDHATSIATEKDVDGNTIMTVESRAGKKSQVYITPTVVRIDGREYKRGAPIHLGSGDNQQIVTIDTDERGELQVRARRVPKTPVLTPDQPDREMQQVAISVEGNIQISDNFESDFRAKLRKEGILKGKQIQNTIQLTEKELVVNGVKQSAATHASYLQFAKNVNTKMCDKCKFTITIEEK